jgi:hypothetical protein
MREKRKIFLFFLTMILSFQFIGSALTEQLTAQTVLSQGIIIYPPSPPTATTRGELYLWVQHWMSAGDSEAQRIAWAGDQGITVWIDSGNWGSPQLTSAFINYFHAHGVKVVCRLWSNGGLNSLNDLLHQMTPRDPIRGSIDYQMSIGPEIDAFMIDECNQYNPSYYKTIADYVHSKGKLMFVNPGGPNIQTSYQWADKVSVEFCWWGLINDSTKAAILAANPQKFIGVSKDYGYHMDSIYDPYIAPKSASGERPSALPFITLNRAIWDTQTAWEGGIFCMAAVPDDNSYLPTWWEQYVAALT